MKIIRHSRKMFVYSLPLLFYLQSLFCGITQKNDDELKSMIKRQGCVGELIDILQQEIGLADNPAEPLSFDITFPQGRDHEHSETIVYTKDRLLDLLNTIHQQRMRYDARTFYASTQHDIKRYNKQVIRTNFLTLIAHARAYQDQKLLQCATPIPNLSQNPKDVDVITLITNLQTALGGVQNKSLVCAGQSVSAILSDIKSKHNFFENETPCCSPLIINDAELNHRIELRSQYITYLNFAQLQLYKQMLAQQTQKTSTSSAHNADPFDPRGIGAPHYNQSAYQNINPACGSPTTQYNNQSTNTLLSNKH